MLRLHMPISFTRNATIALRKRSLYVKITPPSLSGQQQFWNSWNASYRDPGKLNQRTLRRGEEIIALVRSLGLDKPEILDFGCGTG